MASTHSCRMLATCGSSKPSWPKVRHSACSDCRSMLASGPCRSTSAPAGLLTHAPNLLSRSHAQSRDYKLVFLMHKLSSISVETQNHDTNSYTNDRARQSTGFQ